MRLANYSVFKDDDGQWKAKNDSKSRAASSHGTQRDAINAARGYLENAGGGELKVHGLDGKIRAKDTIPPGNDPYPPKG